MQKAASVVVPISQMDQTGVRRALAEYDAARDAERAAQDAAARAASELSLASRRLAEAAGQGQLFVDGRLLTIDGAKIFTRTIPSIR